MPSDESSVVLETTIKIEAGVEIDKDRNDEEHDDWEVDSLEQQLILAPVIIYDIEMGY